MSISFKIRDIAREAGVSTATVSRALNTPDLVLPETREKIFAVINHVNYVPNPLAKALSTGRTNIIAMVLPTMENAVFAMIAEGCQRYLVQINLNLVVITGNRYARKELDILQSVDQRLIKGIIISGSAFTKANHKKILANLKVPSVIIENLPNPKYNTIYIDDINGFEKITDYFIQQGHRRIGLIAGEPSFIVTQRRFAAVQNYLENRYRGMVELVRVSALFSSIQSGMKAMHTLFDMSDPPTAVMCMNDLLAIGALRAARERAMRVPDDVSIMGFDDIPIARYYSPTLSTVQCPNLELGEQAARLLVKQIDNPGTSRENILLPVTLQIRESTR